MSHTLQSELESGQEARIVQIEFSAAFDSQPSGEFCISSVLGGIGGSVLSILTQFLSNRYSTLWWTVVGVNWLTSCQECRREVFWVRYCSSYTARSFFPILENKTIGYADDSTLESYSSRVPGPRTGQG